MRETFITTTEYRKSKKRDLNAGWNEEAISVRFEDSKKLRRKTHSLEKEVDECWIRIAQYF